MTRRWRCETPSEIFVDGRDLIAVMSCPDCGFHRELGAGATIFDLRIIEEDHHTGNWREQ